MSEQPSGGIRDFLLPPVAGLLAGAGGALVYSGVLNFGMTPAMSLVAAVCYVTGSAAAVILSAVKSK